MKFLRGTFVFLVAVILFDGVLTYALEKAVVPTSTIAVNIPAGGNVWTKYVTKNNYGDQTYYNKFTNTALTSPCPKCPIGVKWEKDDGSSTERTVYMGDTKRVNLTSLYDVGSYHIRLRRTDVTLLDTYTSGEWFHN